jgi:hypothetical protein
MEITLTLTIHADRLAALADFLLERETLTVTPEPPPPDVLPDVLPDEKPKKPARGRGRPKGAKNKAKVATPEPTPEVEHTEDDVRAAVRAAVESGGLDKVSAVFSSVGANCLSAIKAVDFDKVIAALKA